MGISAGLAAVGGRRGKRAALRGLLAVSGSSVICTGILKRLLPRRRPAPELFPYVGLRRRHTSSSMPSGHSASAAAFATAAAMEAPILAAPLGALAAAVAYSRVYNGVHYPGDVVFGGAIGIAVAVATTRVWPTIDDSPASARRVASVGRDANRRSDRDRSDGAGITFVVNAGAKSGRGNPTDELRTGLPAAGIVVLEDADGLEAALRDAAAGANAIGVVGGDGSINTAVAVALEYRCPLVVVPGGTLNHFARDLGLASIDDAVRAVQDGQIVEVDVCVIDGRPFVNTASLGSYSKLVEAREQLETTIGKWPALAVALMRVLRDNDPFEITIDGRARRIWMIFIGNCAYDPAGFAPATRARLDDGFLDVRIVEGSAPWARVRLIAAALAGTLARSKVYNRALVAHVTMSLPAGENLLAADGEVFAGHSDFTVAKSPQRLRVYALRPED
jgi:diacylglycerol kinase family enzyme